MIFALIILSYSHFLRVRYSFPVGVSANLFLPWEGTDLSKWDKSERFYFSLLITNHEWLTNKIRGTSNVFLLTSVL